ncbi:MAG: CHASE2 domain-containing protein, partial [Synechococcales bacterium]|nr:CHASE2 domain-containing protein [Synechococcales bacterium]
PLPHSPTHQDLTIQNHKSKLQNRHPLRAMMAKFPAQPISQLVILNLGAGNWQQGFPAIAAQIWIDQSAVPMQVTGHLPALPDFAQRYHQWQARYDLLYRHFARQAPDRSPSLRNPVFEIEAEDITHISQAEFQAESQQLRQQLHQFLMSAGFQRIEQQLRTHLRHDTVVRIIILAEEISILRFPWHLWQLLDDYPQAEIAISLPDYAQPLQIQRQQRDRVHILAIFGNSDGIDLEQDRQCLTQLPQASVTFLVEPSIEQFNQQLWQSEWDILFFAGHSSSRQHPNQSGYLYVNRTDRMTLEQLKYGLRHAIAQGLQLAIFNSCDGIGLARDLAQLHIPQVIVFRESVPDRIAQAFLQNFLLAFAQGLPLYPAVRQAREQLQGLESQFPCATWLPVICQNPAQESPCWSDWITTPESQERLLLPSQTSSVATTIAPLVQSTPATLKKRDSSILGRWLIPLLSGSVITISLWILRSLGSWQSWEWTTYDSLLRLRPTESPDTRLLIVTVTEADIQDPHNAPRQGSLSDRTTARLLAKLQAAQPRVIGLDIYRDFPSQDAQLTQQFQHNDRLFTICKRPTTGNQSQDGILPPPEMAESQIGFSDFVQDQDGVLRRQLIAMSAQPAAGCRAPYAFSTLLTLRYLYDQGITPQFTANHQLQLGAIVLPQISRQAVGYRSTDTRGLQLLLNFRNPSQPQAIAPQVTVAEVLNNQVNPAAIRDRIVLIGVTAPTSSDRWTTPYGRSFAERLPGITLQAHMVSQLLSAVLDQRPLLRTVSPRTELLWTIGWVGLGLAIGWKIQQRGLWAISLGGATLLLMGSGYGGLLLGYWIPLIPPGMGMFSSAIVGRLFQPTLRAQGFRQET